MYGTKTPEKESKKSFYCITKSFLNCGDLGSCQTEKGGGKSSFNAGQASSDVVFLSSGLLSLTYSNGTVCRHHNSKPRSTTIHFICASGVGMGKPEFVGEDPDGCSYIFSWHTDLACDREVCWFSFVMVYFEECWCQWLKLFCIA